MAEVPQLDPAFRRFLLGIVDIAERDLDKVVSELRFHWSESVEEFVRRRHRELQRAGVPNRTVYARIAQELQDRPVRAAPRSERQIRRILYG